MHEIDEARERIQLGLKRRIKVSEEDRKLLRSFGPPGGPRGPRKDGPHPKKD